MFTYSVPQPILSWTGQLPPLLQAAGWERASPAGSVQISCPLTGGKGQAWQDTNEEARPCEWSEVGLEQTLELTGTELYNGQKGGSNSAEATGQAGWNTALSSGNTAPPDVSQMFPKMSGSGGNSVT